MQSIPVGATGSFSIVVMPDHLASRFKDVTLPPVLATPAGRRVTGKTKVTNVDGWRVEFSIRATDGNEEIGVGQARARGHTAVDVIRTNEGHRMNSTDR